MTGMHSKTGRFIAVLLASIAFLAAPGASAQSDDAAAWGHEFGLHVGSLLPNQIEGVSEIMPIVGFRYAGSLSYGALEGGVVNSHAHGADVSVFSLSYRGELAPMPDLATLFYAGPDLHYYRPTGQSGRRSETGFHVGSGMMLLLGGPLWFRADMKFNMNPGTALFIGVGIAVRAPGGGS